MKVLRRMVKVVSLSLLVSGIVPMKEASAAEPVTGHQVIEYSKQFMGVPYVFGGTTPSGFDCSGFIRYVFDKLGVDLPRTAAQQYNVGKAVSRANLQPGDIVFFQGTYKAGISHNGIYIGDNKFIHASSSQGVSITSMSNSYWSPKFAGAKRVLEYPVGSLFKDVADGHSAFEAIKELNEENIIKGYENGTYRPQDEVTRGQAAAIIARALDLTASPTTKFSDVNPANGFADDIAAIEQAGIINGYSDGTYRPYDSMTRAQMAVIVKRAFESNVSRIAGENPAPAYNDVPSSYWAYDEINTIYHIDKTEVYQTSSFRATDETTRAEFAAAIYSAK
ncbi:MAG TPA: NlpC/P60 family protein [Chondromyces sp.]|nr:NlpC/P60 family protein [Chondromyces sp.]